MSDSLKKLLRDPAALEWLKQHPEFGGPDQYRGGKRAFSRNANPAAALFMEKLELVQDRLSEPQRRVAGWFITMAPRDVAKRYRMPVKQVYRSYESLRAAVELEYRKYRDEQVGGRVGQAKLDSTPEHCALATRHFELRGTRQVVYLVQQPSGPVWVDSQAQIFSADVQDVLDELHEHAADFEVMDGE